MGKGNKKGVTAQRHNGSTAKPKRHKGTKAKHIAFRL